MGALLALLLQVEAAERELTETWGPLLHRVELAGAAMEDALAEMKAAAPPEEVEERHRLFWGFRVRKGFDPVHLDLHERAKGVEALRDVWSKHPIARGPAPMSPARMKLPVGVVKAVQEGYAAARRRHAGLLAADKAAAIRWTERQIKELYEPLLQLNARGLAAVKGYQKTSGDDTEQARWKVWAEREFLPRNAETAELLGARFGLIEGEGPSDGIRAFLLHQHSWALRHAFWKEHGGDYDWGSRTNWPVAFSMECESAYQVLLDRRARLVAGE